MDSGDIVRMFVFGINRRHCVRGCCGLDAIKAFVSGQCRGTDRRCGFGDRCRRFFTRLLVIGLGRGQNDGCVPRLSRVDPQLFSALFQNSQNFGIKFWRLCPKKNDLLLQGRENTRLPFSSSRKNFQILPTCMRMSHRTRLTLCLSYLSPFSRTFTLFDAVLSRHPWQKLIESVQFKVSFRGLIVA